MKRRGGRLGALALGAALFFFGGLATPSGPAQAQPQARKVGAGAKKQRVVRRRVAKARRPVEETTRGPYLGVAPGTNDQVPRTRARRGQTPRVATWVGFQWVGEGGRVFIQANHAPEYTLIPANHDEIVLDLPGTRLRTRNDSRALDTGWFPTAVASVSARQVGKDLTRVTIKLREIVGYDLRQEGNYLLLDFRPPTQPIEPPAL